MINRIHELVIKQIRYGTADNRSIIEIERDLELRRTIDKMRKLTG